MTEIKLDVSNIQPLLDTLKQMAPDAELTLTNGETPIATVKIIKVLPSTPRLPDLNPGVWLSEDFNDILPDHYWRTRSL